MTFFCLSVLKAYTYRTNKSMIFNSKKLYETKTVTCCFNVTYIVGTLTVPGIDWHNALYIA
jgi:hypothetical protein